MEQSEKTHIKELESIGFEIEYTLDTTGYLYKMHLRLPWYCVNIAPEFRKHFKPFHEYAMEFILNRVKRDIVNRSSSFFNFKSQSWCRDRDFDQVMIELLKYINDNPDVGLPVISLNRGLTPETKDTRRIDGHLSDAIDSLW